MGRQPYWLCFAFICLVMSLLLRLWMLSLPAQPTREEMTLAAFLSSNPLIPFVLLTLNWIEIAMVIKRLQDLGRSGFWALLIFLPFVNLLMFFLLGFVPSQDKPNRSGPMPNSYWRKS